jgi:hypothetical protein
MYESIHSFIHSSRKFMSDDDDACDICGKPRPSVDGAAVRSADGDDDVEDRRGDAERAVGASYYMMLLHDARHCRQ